MNTKLLKRFGYDSARGNKRKELHTTINAESFNQLKGRPGFKIKVGSNRLYLINIENEELCYWEKDLLKNAFERKIPKLLYVKADFRGKGSHEEFWFNEAWLLSGFDFENFVELVKNKVVFIDIRIGQYPNGRTHDHGTAFRISPDKLDLCFTHREKVI